MTEKPHTGDTTRRTCRGCRAIRQRLYRRRPRAQALQKSRNKWLKTVPGYKAKQEVFKAVRKGTLARASDLNCIDCGAIASCYDHRDYSKPLMVEPVCRSCNWKRGPAY